MKSKSKLASKTAAIVAATLASLSTNSVQASDLSSVDLQKDDNSSHIRTNTFKKLIPVLKLNLNNLADSQFVANHASHRSHSSHSSHTSHRSSLFA